MEKSLFRVKTRGCGVFYVIATTFDYAAGEVRRELNAQDYGGQGSRSVWYNSPQKAFGGLIDRLNGRGTWQRNEWQFAYTFRLIK